MANQYEYKRAQKEFVEIEVIKAKNYFKENALQIMEGTPSHEIRNLRKEAKSMIVFTLPKQQQAILEFRNKRKSVAEQEPNPFETAIPAQPITVRDELRSDSVLKHTEQLSTQHATLHATLGDNSSKKTVIFGKRGLQSSETMQLKYNAERQIEGKIARPNKATRL